MPGLFGILSKSNDISRDRLRSMALRMADSMRSVPWLQTDLFACDRFCGGRVHLGVLNPRPQPMIVEGDRLRIWFDGEIYPDPEGRGETPTGEEVVELFGTPGSLSEVDGVFAMVCYDEQRQELLLANDRLGLRPVYYMEDAQWFAYAAEVKALLAICATLPDLDEISLCQFFGLGYMLGERTWWQNIKLVPPASVLHVSSSGRTLRRYWTFDRILCDPLPESEVLQEFGEAWSRAVRQRSKPGKMPILLSGGLDSRLLLAELREQGADLVAITFGSLESTDLRIARKCAATAGIPHRPLVLTAQNWWQRREEAIWQTDGLTNAIDLHVAIAADEMHVGSCYSPMNFAGDLLFGGSYLAHGNLDDWRSEPHDLIARKYLSNPLYSCQDLLDASQEDVKAYLCGPSSDCFYIYQRVRRCTVNGPQTTASHCEPVYPSLSLALMRLILGGLRDQQRMGSRFYNRFLVANYPAFFRDIPWQHTGRGLAETGVTRLTRDVKHGVKGQIHRLIRKPPPAYARGFADYPLFLKSSGVREKLLKADLLTDAITNGRARSILADGTVDSSSGHISLCALLTIETYLRQVANLPRMTELQQ